MENVYRFTVFFDDCPSITVEGTLNKTRIYWSSRLRNNFPSVTEIVFKGEQKRNKRYILLDSLEEQADELAKQICTK